MQAKGVVGRFFSELTRHNSIGDAALARQPSVSAALAAAGLDRLAVNPLASPHSRARVRASLDGRREGQGSGALAGGLQVSCFEVYMCGLANALVLLPTQGALQGGTEGLE